MASGPNVQHQFSGDDNGFVAKSVNQRLDVRQALTALQKEFSRFESRPTRVTAEIKFQTSSDDAKELAYKVTITDSGFDVSRSTSTRRSTDGNDGVEIRPFKKSRTGADGGNQTAVRTDDSDDNAQQSTDAALAFMKQWHKEWHQQGGWLFDTLTRAGTVAQQGQVGTEKKLAAMQDVLGQSINTANSTNVSEFDNIKKLIPWLETCRKTSDDKVQAREEKWRSSSATFHDQSRRDREMAEKRLEEKLDAQNRLLVRLARANGIDLDDDSREGSLGAQLTAELNLEAARAGKRNRLEAISIDDDDDDID